MRKPGKLPADTISATYALEYGEGTIEMHSDAFPKGSNVLIHDDLIATGGSALAATRLVEKLESTVVGYSFIVELQLLNGRSNLSDAADIDVLVILYISRINLFPYIYNWV